MTGGNSKILAEKDSLGSSVNKTFRWTQEEAKEAEKLRIALNIYADRNISREIDASDLKEAVSYAFQNEDLDLMRVYNQSLSDSLDTFIIDRYVRILRKYDYSPVAGFFNEKTVEISQSILSDLISSSTGNDRVLADGNSDKICAYAMANPDKYHFMRMIIMERRVTSYGQLMEMVDGDIAPAVLDGVL